MKYSDLLPNHGDYCQSQVHALVSQCYRAAERAREPPEIDADWVELQLGFRRLHAIPPGQMELL